MQTAVAELFLRSSCRSNMVSSRHNYGLNIFLSPLPGPVTTRGGLFSPEFATGMGPSSFTLPGKETENKQGAIFVLTSGRGLINLRPGVRTPALFPTIGAKASSMDKDEEEGCMISYEVEITQ